MPGPKLAIFTWELRTNRNALTGWSIGMAILVLSGMAKFGAYQGSPEALAGLLEQIPRSLQIVMGLDAPNLSTAIGFFGMMFLYVAVLATIHAVMLGANIISKEERDRTSEFLYVKPVSRSQVLTSKLLAALVNIVVLNVVTFLSTVFIVNYFEKKLDAMDTIFVMMAGLLLLQLIFLTLGLALAATKKLSKNAASAGAGMLLATFVLSVVIDLNSHLAFLKYATPFKYFEAKQMIGDNHLNWPFSLLAVLIIGTLIVATYRSYRARDLRV